MRQFDSLWHSWIWVLQNSVWSMAFCLHSAFLSSEYNNLCSTTQFTSNGRWFPGRRMDGYNGGLVMVKLWSNCKRATHNQFLRNSRLYCGLDSRFLDILSNGRSKIFSLCNIEAIMKVVLWIYFPLSFIVQVAFLSIFWWDYWFSFLFVGRVKTDSIWKQQLNWLRRDSGTSLQQ